MLWPHIADHDLIVKRCEVPDRAVVNPISNKWLPGQTNILHPNPPTPSFFCHVPDKRGNWHQWNSLWSVTWQSIITEGNSVITGAVIRNQALRSLGNCLWNTGRLQVLSINAITNACSYCCTKTSSGVQDKPNTARRLILIGRVVNKSKDLRLCEAVIRTCYVTVIINITFYSY
jgi:hypothetical protein